MKKMEARELRIGNWVLLNGRPFQIDKIETTCVSAMGNWNPNDDYSPIPITSEWIERFGFEYLEHEVDNEDGEFDIYESYKINERKFQYRININPIPPHEFAIKWRWAHEGVLNHVEFIHQVQNLYFALTGKELK